MSGTNADNFMRRLDSLSSTFPSPELGPDTSGRNLSRTDTTLSLIAGETCRRVSKHMETRRGNLPYALLRMHQRKTRVFVSPSARGIKGEILRPVDRFDDVSIAAEIPVSKVVTIADLNNTQYTPGR